MGMQGLAYMHSDLGGFAGANLDDELYIRWLQYGVFNPIFRPHAQEDVASEPVFRSEKAKTLAKEAIELRYRMLPYNYNMMYENHKYGWPLMRPLFFEECKDVLFTDDSAYLWGNDILVSPVTYADAKMQIVYLPESSNWFDFYSNKEYKGGIPISYNLQENAIPTFVRGGAFIPMTKTIQSTSDYDANSINVHYFFDASIEESERKFYNDDGKTPNAYEKGVYEILEFEAEIDGRWLEIQIEVEIGKNYKAQDKKMELIVHNMLYNPKRIKVGKKKIKGNWNSKKKTLTIPVSWNTAEGKEIKIKLKK